MSNRIFKFKDKTIEAGDTLICGILNVTPDSFSDGGKYFGLDKALKQAERLIAEGAQILDMGGESTRPGSTRVEEGEEIERIIPVIEKIKKEFDIILSVDTWKSQVAKAAIEAGGDIINDITGLVGDRDMAKVISNTDAGLISMFNPVIVRPGHPGSKIFPSFGGEGAFTKEELEKINSYDIITACKTYFNKSLELAEKNGIDRNRIMLDPGIGFGLTKKENLQLVNEIDFIHEDYNLFSFLGVSRKRFITNILTENHYNVDVETEEGFFNRDISSTYLTVIGALKGVDVIRVHEIPYHKMAKIIGKSIRNADGEEDINFGTYKKMN